jgi:hypothetical protein
MKRPFSSLLAQNDMRDHALRSSRRERARRSRTRARSLNVVASLRPGRVSEVRAAGFTQVRSVLASGAPGKADRRLRRAPSPRQAGCARRICALGFKIGLVSPTPGRHRSRRSGARCFSPVRGPPAAPRSDAWRHCRVRSKATKGTVAACPCQPPFHGLPVLVRARGHYTRHAGMCIGPFVRAVGRERDKLRSRELRVESRMSRRRF